MIQKTYRFGFTAEDLRTLQRENIGKITGDQRLLLQHAVTLVAKSGWQVWNDSIIEMRDKSMTPVIVVKSGSCTNHVIIHFDGYDRTVDYYEKKGWGFWLYEKVIVAWDKFIQPAITDVIGKLGGTAVLAIL